MSQDPDRITLSPGSPRERAAEDTVDFFPGKGLWGRQKNVYALRGREQDLDFLLTVNNALFYFSEYTWNP